MRLRHTAKSGRRYRYYVSDQLIKGATGVGGGWRIPVRPVESVVAQIVQSFLTDGVRVARALQLDQATPEIVGAALQKALAIAATVQNGTLEEQRDQVRSMIARVSVHPDLIRIEIKLSELRRLLLGSDPVEEGASAEATFEIAAPIQFKRRGVEAKLVIRSTSAAANPDAKLIRLVVQAHLWIDDLVSGRAASVREIALRSSIDEGDVSRFIPLAFLAPDIVEAVLAGKQPIELTSEKLKRLTMLPHAWEDQRRLLGFPS
jgi:hypothetical protein